MLRLGRKYEFSDIRTLAMRTLRIQVPVDELGSWDHFWDRDNVWGNVDDLVPGPWLSGHEIDLLNLVIEQDIQTIVPMAYYICTHFCSLVSKVNQNVCYVLLKI
jgi:hypothetical protein